VPPLSSPTDSLVAIRISDREATRVPSCSHSTAATSCPLLHVLSGMLVVPVTAAVGCTGPAIMARSKDWTAQSVRVPVWAVAGGNCHVMPPYPSLLLPVPPWGTVPAAQPTTTGAR
jgi:hypothetical protein